MIYNVAVAHKSGSFSSAESKWIINRNQRLVWRWKLKCKHNSLRFLKQTINYKRTKHRASIRWSIFFIHKWMLATAQSRKPNKFSLHHQTFSGRIATLKKEFYDIQWIGPRLSSARRVFKPQLQSSINNEKMAFVFTPSPPIDFIWNPSQQIRVEWVLLQVKR